MHETLDKTNTGELTLKAIRHRIAQAEQDDQAPQALGEMVPLSKGLVYTVLFSSATLILVVAAVVIAGGLNG